VRVVVGAVLRDAGGRVLAARRERPAGWELPGGKVEPGETEPAALVRELREELGVTVEVGDRIGPDVPMGPDLLLRAWTAVLTAGEPAALEHAELRWLAEDELDSVAWLPADGPVVAALTTSDGRRPAPAPAPGIAADRGRDPIPPESAPRRPIGSGAGS
jgi:8-oxo-dGTP diphosphatase